MLLKLFFQLLLKDLGDGDVEFTGESVSSSLWEEKVF